MRPSTGGGSARKIVRKLGQLWATNASSNPRRISAAVQNCADANHIRLDPIINRKRKPFTQTAVISENFWVNAAVDDQ